MYRSLERVSDDFKLYIYAFDDKANEILKDLNLKHAVILSKEDLEKEYPILLKLKEERSKAEYCWTCTPITIEYVLNKFGEDSCTYIDSDLYFFSDPQVLFDELKKSDDNIIITPHRFPNTIKGSRTCKRSGKYCVEFNYFDNSKEARETLTWWKERCFEWCYHLYEPERMGDQKYLEKFPKMFKKVHELENLGGGVAPWNLSQYELLEGKLHNKYADPETGKDSPKVKNASESVNITLREKTTGIVFDLIFYHFQNLRYLSLTKVNISSETHSKKTKDAIYRPYLKKIEFVRKELKEKYDLNFDVKKIYSSNKLIAFLQGSVLRFRIKSLSDIYDLTKL